MDEKKYYCSYCGRELEKKAYVDYISPLNGESVMVDLRTCPISRRNRYKFKWNPHDEKVFFRLKLTKH